MDYPPMPCPVGEVEDGRYGDFSNNNLINAELLYDKAELESSYWQSASESCLKIVPPSKPQTGMLLRYFSILSCAAARRINYGVALPLTPATA
ncbi:hypothetical protein PIB30_104343, partial [Stylosanthes scabra]|nr:hypothetical protein [Stylosanthes scabra]